MAQEIFSKCFLVMLAHIQRKFKKDPDYKEPCFLRAFMIAFEGAMEDDAKFDENYAGVSISDDQTEGYAAIVRKHKEGFELINLHDLAIDREVEIRSIFRLITTSILVDNLEEEILWSEAIEVLERMFPDIKFVKFPNNQWKKYRTKFIEEVWKGKVHGYNMASSELAELRDAKEFNQVPQHIRIVMGVLYSSQKYPEESCHSFTSFSTKVSNTKIFEISKELIYGRSSEYTNPFGDEK